MSGCPRSQYHDAVIMSDLDPIADIAANYQNLPPFNRQLPMMVPSDGVYHGAVSSKNS
jgi:hypothetical protein